MDTFILCPNGEKEGIINDKTKYIVRIDGDITKDAELTVKEDKKPKAKHITKHFDNKDMQIVHDEDCTKCRKANK